MIKQNDRPDRFASGTRGDETNDSADNETRPGVTGGSELYLPESGGEGAQGSGASSAEGTIGAVGEMDLTGAPVEAGASSSAGQSEGGGPGGGAISGSGTGAGTGGSDNDR